MNQCLVVTKSRPDPEDPNHLFATVCEKPAFRLECVTLTVRDIKGTEVEIAIPICQDHAIIMDGIELVAGVT